MKPETAALLKKFHNSKRLQFLSTERGLELDHDLSDEEKLELVQNEYGNSLTGSVDDLFVVIIKKIVRMASDKVRQDV